MRTATVLVMSFLFVLVSVAVSADNPTAAVVSLRNDGGLSQGEVNIVTDRVDYALSRTKHFTLVSRRQIDEILKEQGFQQSGACGDDQCVIQVGQILAVEKIVSGSIGKMGAMYTVSLNAYDVRTGGIDAQVTRDVQDSKERLLSKHIPELVGQLVGRLEGTVDGNSDEKVHRSIARRPLFWVAGGALVVGGAAAALVLSQQDQSDPNGDPANVPGTGSGDGGGVGAGGEIILEPPPR